MRRITAVILALALVFSGALAAHAASLSGHWKAKFQVETLELQLKGSGNAYSGTFTISVKNGAKTVKSVMPVKLAVKVINKLTTVTMTMTKDKTVVQCALVKSALRCIATNQQVIVFSHTHA